MTTERGRYSSFKTSKCRRGFLNATRFQSAALMSSCRVPVPQDMRALAEKDERTLMVRQLHPRTGEFDLFQLFSTAGTVTDVRLITDERSGKCVGVAYVEMAKVEDLEKAMRLTGSNLCGNPIFVQSSLAVKNQMAAQGARTNHCGRAWLSRPYCEPAPLCFTMPVLGYISASPLPSSVIALPSRRVLE